MTDTFYPEPGPEQAAMMARVRKMMLIAGVTTAVAIGAVLIAIGYRLFTSEGSAPATDITARLPKGAKIYATAVAGDRLVLMLDVNGQTEIRTFDAHTLKPTGSLKFTTEP
jgi:TRAP-type C4-dicarboxylate transport system permease small subunit